MKEFLEKSLRQNVTITEDNEIYKKLPLVYRGRYEIFKVETNGVFWMAVQPKNETGLVLLRKDRLQVEKAADLNCAIFFNNTTFYIKEKLMEEGVPFVIKDKQVFLPFIGYLSSNTGDRKLAPVSLISFLTQKMLLIAIYEKWKGVKASEVAECLGISRKSASRCFDELEYLNIDMLGMKGKTRVISVSDNPKAFWDQIKGVLRNPVIRRFYFSEDLRLNKKAGISALCEYSLLSDNEYATYAVTKSEITDSGIKAAEQISLAEGPKCAVLELGYFIDLDDEGIQDPLSAALSMTEEEQKDERVCISIKEMLEEYVWSRD